MGNLSEKERELVALGAALGSNCMPCIVYHVAVIKRLGVADRDIKEAIEVADKVRSMPAAQVLETAYAQIEETRTDTTKRKKCGAPDCGC